MNALSWVTGIASAYRKEKSEFMNLENQCKIDSREMVYIWRYNLSGQNSSRPGEREGRVSSEGMVEYRKDIRTDNIWKVR